MMPRLPAGLLLATALLFAPTLEAQKMPVPDSSGRLLQLFDLDALADAPRNEPAPAAEGASRAPESDGLADFLRPFVTPAFGPGDDVRLLGDRWLAVLAAPEQIAFVERMFAAARERRHDLLGVQVKLLHVKANDFADLARQKLTPVQHGDATSYEAVLNATAFQALEAGLAARDTVDTMTAPRVTLQPMQRGEVSTINQTAYVKDFTLTRRGDMVIADPIVDIVWSGVRADVRGTFLPGGALGLRCVVTMQDVEKPIPTFETKVTGLPQPLSIQLPHVTGVRLEQTCQLAAGDGIVLGAERLDGSFLLALITATVTPAPK